VLPEEGDWRVRVVPNLYPALERQEVVVHSRRHIRSLAEVEGDEPELIAEAWRRRAAAHDGYVFALVNEGREAGSSLPHAHSQLAWLPDTPPKRARPLLEQFLERDGLVAGCPWASRVPY
jgi:UDPglucose--hexose-1-phosphate uridylyltransferase